MYILTVKNRNVTQEEETCSDRTYKPIALTDVGYRLFTDIMRSKIVEHLDRNGLISDF